MIVLRENVVETAAGFFVGMSTNKKATKLTMSRPLVLDLEVALQHRLLASSEGAQSDGWIKIRLSRKR